jgi:hypothetical protein
LAKGAAKVSRNKAAKVVILLMIIIWFLSRWFDSPECSPGKRWAGGIPISAATGLPGSLVSR